MEEVVVRGRCCGREVEAIRMRVTSENYVFEHKTLK